MPRFLTNEALVTIVPSKERQHSENSFTRCFGANTISSVLSWFNLSIFELINTLTSDKQVSRRLDIFFQLSSGLITRYKTASTLWNNLPSETRYEQSLEFFKKNVKTYLFRIAYCDFT
jgi:hypothetical protein